MKIVVKTFGTVGILLLVIGINHEVFPAGNVAAGKKKAAMCIACHGEDGIGKHQTWPNLAGQKKEYLISQMKAYRDGARKNDMMTPMMVGLSNKDIVNLAVYYSSLSCK